MPAKEIFDDIENKQIISKDSYIKLYESWSKTDIEQITGLLLLIQDHIYVETDLGDDEKGDYGDFTVENQTEKYTVRVYAPNDFLMAMSVHHFENCYYIPVLASRSFIN